MKNTTYSIVMLELLPVGTALLDVVEGTVVARFAIPEAVVIVGHHVNQVQIIYYGWEIVCLIRDRFESRDGGGEALPAV